MSAQNNSTILDWPRNRANIQCRNWWWRWRYREYESRKKNIPNKRMKSKTKNRITKNVRFGIEWKFDSWHTVALCCQKRFISSSTMISGSLRVCACVCVCLFVCSLIPQMVSVVQCIYYGDDECGTCRVLCLMNYYDMVEWNRKTHTLICGCWQIDHDLYGRKAMIRNWLKNILIPRRIEHTEALILYSCEVVYNIQYIFYISSTDSTNQDEYSYMLNDVQWQAYQSTSIWLKCKKINAIRNRM